MTMTITPTRYEIKVEISDERKCIFVYELNNPFYTNYAELTFNENTTLSEIAKSVVECFRSEELSASCIDFKFHESEVRLYKGNFEEITENAILESMACQIK